MFKSTENASLSESHQDLSYARCDSWPAFEGGHALMMSLGHEDDGPVVVLASLPLGAPIDEAAGIELAKQTGFVHMHRSDSFRMSLRGGLIVGRRHYEPGDIRLQESGTYYGPEAITGGDACWIMLMFADRHGYRIQAANDRDLPAIDAMEQPVIPIYEDLGCHPVHPADALGTAAVRTTTGVETRGGHLDASFTDRDGWSTLGNAQAAGYTVGHRQAGPVVLTLRVPPGGEAVPAATWGTEVLTAVVDGSCAIGATTYTAGELRVQQAGSAQPAVVAGPEGASVLVVIGDRQQALPTLAEGADTRWGDELTALLARLQRALVAV